MHVLRESVSRTALLAGIHADTMTEWRKDPEFSGAGQGRPGEL